MERIVAALAMFLPTLPIVAAERSPLPVETVVIPGADYEPGGPTYSFHIGRYEITNTQSCVFLNDAEACLQTTPEDPRCTNMWIDPINADVYMEDVTGYGSTDKLDRTLYKTSDVPDSKIKYNAAGPLGSRFYVLAGYEDHPVGTVSWYGAAKFCNWLTLNHGLPAADVCYHEGSSKEQWYAVTASTWAVNGLLPEERLALVRDYRGFRLPMDGQNTGGAGPGVATTWNNTTNPYSEWYKACAFDPAAPEFDRPGPGDGEIIPAGHWTFGFGADTWTPADANLLNSLDPFLETTPIGWYNGTNLLTDGTPTNDTRNRYGLYDLCGNGSEWLTDTALESPWGAVNYRITRGGNFANNDAKYATTSLRVVTGARYCAENNITLRVARSPGYGDFNADDAIGEADYLFWSAALTGPVDTVVPGNGHEACDYDADTHVDLADFAVLQQRFTRP